MRRGGRGKGRGVQEKRAAAAGRERVPSVRAAGASAARARGMSARSIARSLVDLSSLLDRWLLAAIVVGGPFAFEFFLPPSLSLSLSYFPMLHALSCAPYPRSSSCNERLH